MATTPNSIPAAEAQVDVRRYNVHMKNPANHPGQMQLWGAVKKRILIRAGRRGGKTTGAAMKAVQAFMKGKRVLYAVPTIDQVQRFWSEVKKALDEAISGGLYYKNEVEHIIEVQGTEQRIRAKTAWNAETLRGDYADLLILDEWQSMDETAWTEVGAPMLIDNNGDVVFIYTPPSLETRSASKAKDPLHAAKLFKAKKNDPNWLLIHFTTSDNPHVSEEGLRNAQENMTALAYRQEILAEDVDEVPGALWTRKIIEDSRVDVMPCAARRIVVAIDPSGGNLTEVGIVTAAEGADGHVYVIKDDSLKAERPKKWAQTAVWVYHQLGADRIVAEKNYGGDMVEETLRAVDESVSYKAVDASRGKLVRAEPILALFQRKMMHLVGKFPELEDELCSYSAAPGQKSPNRLDAMVWAGTELKVGGSLGLLDFFSSGGAERVMGRSAPRMTPRPGAVAAAAVRPSTQQQPMQKVSGGGDLAAIATSDKTPHCPKCNAITLQNLPSDEKRCQACGHQWFPAGKPQFARPLGQRKMTLMK